jgi:predicted nuclease of predicted toxin-antitoxin system
VRFLVDAQLPRRPARLLNKAGHDAVHTLDLPNGNRTTDSEINYISIREERVVITKDADFVNSFLVSGEPYKLLLVSTGNLANAQMETLIRTYLAEIEEELAVHSFLELSSVTLIVHS